MVGGAQYGMPQGTRGINMAAWRFMEKQSHRERARVSCPLPRKKEEVIMVQNGHTQSPTPHAVALDT